MSGRDSFSITDKVIRCKGGNISDTEGYRLKYGVALEADGTDLDTVLVSVFRAPHSYTQWTPKPSTEATTKDKFINIPQHIQGITDKLVKTHTKLAIFAPQNLLYGSE